MFVFWLVVVPVVSTLVTSALWYLWHLNSRRKVANVPSEPCVPLVGHALKLMDRNAILPNLEKMFDEQGDTFFLVLGLYNFIATRDLKTVETILSSTKVIEKSSNYRFLHRWLGLGLLTSDGPKWKRRRRILTPTYHFQILEQFVPIFDSVGDVLCEQLKQAKDKASIDIYPWISLSALDVISETAMGVTVNALINRESEYLKSVKRMGQIVIDRIFSPVEQIDFLFKFTQHSQEEAKALKVLHDHTMSVITQRRKLLENKEVANEDNEFGIKKRVAFLDMLLQATENGQPLSDEDIREEVDTFMFEGHDTTASGISFALFEIAKHPEVQNKILEEQYEILGKENRPLTYQDLGNMKYLDMVIKESLRMYPSVPFFAREVREDFKLNDKVTVPKGFNLVIFPYFVQRDPKVFENPDSFIPERFSAENKSGNHPYSFVPFSAGPRNCIGQKFAMMEMKATISKIVRCFELSETSPKHSIVLTPELIIKSDNGIFIKIKER